MYRARLGCFGVRRRLRIAGRRSTNLRRGGPEGETELLLARLVGGDLAIDLVRVVPTFG